MAPGPIPVENGNAAPAAGAPRVTGPGADSERRAPRRCHRGWQAPVSGCAESASHSGSGWCSQDPGRSAPAAGAVESESESEPEAASLSARHWQPRVAWPEQRRLVLRAAALLAGNLNPAVTPGHAGGRFRFCFSFEVSTGKCFFGLDTSRLSASIRHEPRISLHSGQHQPRQAREVPHSESPQSLHSPSVTQPAPSELIAGCTW